MIILILISYCFYLLSAPSLQWVRPPSSFWSFYWSTYFKPYIVSIILSAPKLEWERPPTSFSFSCWSSYFKSYIIYLILYTPNLLWDLYHPSQSPAVHPTLNLIMFLSSISSKSSMSETSTILLILLLVLLPWTLYCFFLLPAPSLLWVRPPPSFWSCYWSSCFSC